MQVVGVYFGELGLGTKLAEYARSVEGYHYLMDEDTPVTPGDLVYVNGSIATIVTVDTEETYKPSKPSFAYDKLTKKIEHRFWITREPDRVRFALDKRIKEIRQRLSTIKIEHEARLAIEAQAAAGGEEGKALLAELDALEKELKAAT